MHLHVIRRTPEQRRAALVASLVAGMQREGDRRTANDRVGSTLDDIHDVMREEMARGVRRSRAA